MSAIGRSARSALTLGKLNDGAPQRAIAELVAACSLWRSAVEAELDAATVTELGEADVQDVIGAVDPCSRPRTPFENCLRPWRD
jgi:hypothetical protein